MSGIEPTTTNPETITALVECLGLIWEAGLFDNLSAKTREWIANNEELMKLMTMAKPPKLEPRLTLDEYMEHVMRLFNVPMHQHDFYSVIVKISYLMVLAEKNPMVAQQLRGVVNLGEDLKSLLNVR